jgi:ABC-type multidrug transport system fused ATPase/permease subunit
MIPSNFQKIQLKMTQLQNFIAILNLNLKMHSFYFKFKKTKFIFLSFCCPILTAVLRSKIFQMRCLYNLRKGIWSLRTSRFHMVRFFTLMVFLLKMRCSASGVPILKNVSFEVQPGQRVAIVG